MRFRPRGFHYLGNLGSKLADLQGYATLAHELIQNADDVGDAGFLRFDITHDALVVDNGGVFRSCGELESYDCPWLKDPKREEKHRRRCDFHRFAWIGSGDKRFEENTTGAFGIGFLSVYQITDVPELISAGEHWILNEVATDENQRIEICDGCERCTAQDRPGTRFILPWAFDPDSPLRRGLRAEAVGPEIRHELSSAFRELLPGAMLFLRNLETIELARDGSNVLELRRVCEDADVVVQTDGELRSWRRYFGSFENEAGALRAKYPDKIEEKRSAEVVVTFSDSENDGLLFAWLPTQESTGLACHIHADFFPTSDRKHLHWEADYRSEWNRAALRAAANALGQHLDEIKSHVGHTAFWELCQAAKALADGPREAFRSFWPAMLPAVRSGESVYTHRNEWVVPANATIVDSAYRDCVPVLEALGIEGVHQDLDFARNLLTDRTNGPGVKVLRLSVVNEHLTEVAPVNGTLLDECPTLLKDQALRRQLWIVLERMLASAQAASKEDRERLSRLPLVTGTDHRIWAPADICRADQETADLFAAAGISLPMFVYDEDFPHLSQLSPQVSARAIVESVEQEFPWADEATTAEETDRVTLLEWLATHQGEFDRQPALKQRLAALALFPSGKGYRPLTQLSLPGTFQDPLGVAEVIDVARIRGALPFIESLGAQSLSLPEYVKRHVPRALENEKLALSLRRDLVALLAERIGELRDDKDCHRVLANTRLVECREGEFVLPGEAYFPSKLLKLLPKSAVHVAILEREREHSLRALYEWCAATIRSAG